MNTKNVAPQGRIAKGCFKSATRAITTLMLILTVIALSAGTGLAQQRGKHGPSPEQIIKRLSYELNLTEEQRAEITPIIEAESQKRQELVEEKREEIRAIMEEMHQEITSQLATVLTPEQTELYNEMMEDRKQRHEERDLREEGHERGTRRN